jgi:hypothetical protein
MILYSKNPKRSIAAEIVMNNFKCELFLVQLILKWRSLPSEASATERGKNHHKIVNEKKTLKNCDESLCVAMLVVTEMTKCVH